MTNIRLIVLLLASLILQNNAMNGGVPAARFPEPQSIPRRIAGQFQSRVNNLPALLRPHAEALLSASDLQEKLRLTVLGDSTADSVRDFFADLVVGEPLASVRLELVNYLTRNAPWKQARRNLTFGSWEERIRKRSMNTHCAFNNSYGSHGFPG